MRVGIFCSGLGQVQRGNETWARTLAQKLATLDPGTGPSLDVVLGGAGRSRASEEAGGRLQNVRLWTLSRESIWLRPWTFTQRYILEQRLFFMAVRRFLRRHPVDVVHVADPQLAWWLQRSLSNTGIPVIYKDGLLLGPDWNRRFRFVQLLAPHYLKESEERGVSTSGWRVIPHFVDSTRFQPVQASQRVELRRSAPGGALPEHAWIVLAVGDVSRQSAKRLDWIVDEMARITRSANSGRDLELPHLVVAGNAEEADRRQFEAQGRARLGNRFHFRPRIPPQDMPRLYAAADVLAHAALREPFGLVLIEAMASGLPVVAHRFPVTEWIVGSGGEVVDMEHPGALVEVLARWQSDPEEHRHRSLEARARASDTFSPDRLLPMYSAWYHEIRS